MGEGLQAPDSLRNMSGRWFLFGGSALLLFGAVWLGSCAALYAYATGSSFHFLSPLPIFTPAFLRYHVNVLYEARWMLATLVLSGLLALALGKAKSEAAFLALGLSLVYTIAASVTTLLIYALNLARAAHQRLDSPLHIAVAAPGREEYMQLCAVLVTLALAGIAASAGLLRLLHRLAATYFAPLRLPSPAKRFLRTAAILQGLLALFSVYVTSQIITLSFSYIHTYMIQARSSYPFQLHFFATAQRIVQELFCGILQLSCSGVQLLVLLRPSRLSLTFLFFLNLSQFFQELFYSWNAYYISLYVHSSSAKHAMGLDYDQVRPSDSRRFYKGRCRRQREDWKLVKGHLEQRGMEAPCGRAHIEIY